MHRRARRLGSPLRAISGWASGASAATPGPNTTLLLTPQEHSLSEKTAWGRVLSRNVRAVVFAGTGGFSRAKKAAELVPHRPKGERMTPHESEQSLSEPQRK